MPGAIKGITIEFDADTTKLTKTLNAIKAESKSVDSALKEVNRQLRFDPKNTELLKQKQTLLKQKIDQTKDSLEKFHQIQDDAKAKGVDEQSAAYMKLRREIIQAEGKLKAYNAQLARMKWAPIKNAGAAIQDVGNKLTRATRYARMFAGALVGISLYKGFERLKSLDETSKQLEVLGYRGKELEGIMNGVSNSVDGTRFMLQDMAKVATGALGSGVTKDYKLNEYLTRTADLAQLTGLDVTEMGAMMNKAYSKGKVQAQLMNQFNQRGIPIYKLLQKELGVTADELAEMSKAGDISFDDLYRATERYSGLAQKMGTETLPGAFTVLTQQFGLIGADFLSGVYEPLKEGTRGIVSAIKEMRKEGTFKEWGQDLGDTVKYFVELLTTGAASMDGMSERAQHLATVLTPLITSISTLVNMLAKLPPELQGVLVLMTLFGGPMLSVLGGTIKALADMGAGLQTIGMNAQAGVGPLSQLTGGTTSLSGAVNALISPLGLATLGITAWALGMKKTYDEMHASTIEMENWKTANQDSIETVKASASEVDLYKSKLDQLIKKDHKSAGEKALIKTYVDKLNGAISGLNLKYDEEKDKLNKTTKAIDKKIQKYKEAALVKAYEDIITEAAKKEAKEQLKLADLYEERTQIQEKWQNSTDKSAAAEVGYKMKLADVNAKIRDSKEAINGYRGEMGKAERAISGLSSTSGKEFRKLSNDARREGRKAPAEYSSGISAGKSKARTAASSVASAAKGGLKVSTYQLGTNFGAGFKKGILDKCREVAAAGAKMAADAVKAAKKAAEESSPSKATRRIGRYFGIGFALGIDDENRLAQAASGEMVRSAINAATTRPSGMKLTSEASGQTGTNNNITVNWYVNGADDPEEWAGVAARRLDLLMNSR